jgi:hypothetical protein
MIMPEMAIFRFDPPLQLKNDFSVETLDDATAYARSLTMPRMPKTRESVLFWLERASDDDQRAKAAEMFRAWVNLEGVLVK